MSDEIRLVEVTCQHCAGDGCNECHWVGIWGAPAPQTALRAEVDRLTRECLDREATETDARERLRQAEERLAAVGAWLRNGYEVNWRGKSEDYQYGWCDGSNYQREQLRAILGRAR